MGDLKNSRVILLKGFLFLFLGFLSAGLLLVLTPNLSTAALLVIAVWAFCRFYYFTFYVIERYVDPNYRFAGLGSFVTYLVRRKQRSRQSRE